MEKRIRVLGLIFIGLFALLFIQLNNWQVRQATSYKASVPPANQVQVDQFAQQRGMIITSDHDVIAKSVRVNRQWVRTYPQGPLFADITGYFDVTAHAAPLGMEGEYNQFLAEHQTPVHTFSNLFTTHEETNDVVLTLSAKLQAAAQAALGGQTGAVVALDPQTGAILAMYGNPTYDPNPFSTSNAKKANAYYESLDPNSGTGPLVNEATAQVHPPGSTFKIIDTAALFDHDPSLQTHTWPAVSSITFQGAPPLQNFGGERCGGDLPEILTASCDTSYAQLGLTLGASSLVDEAKAFGFDSTPPIDLPADVTQSQIPAPSQITFPRLLADSAIGQYEDAASALQMAMVSGAIADGGVMMTPHLLNYAINQQGQVVDAYKAHAWRTATSIATAEQVKQLMLGPTNDYNGTSGGTLVGTLSDYDLGGIWVGGKTGTAQTDNPCGGFDWVTAWGPALTASLPTIAVAAWVEPQLTPACNAGTGATVAGPVVQQVLKAYFGVS
jgi:peptidoglycan glycosyltransferase